MSPFDCEKVRTLAEDFLSFMDPKQDREFYRVGMTLRAACNEVDALRAEIQRLSTGATMHDEPKDRGRDEDAIADMKAAAADEVERLTGALGFQKSLTAIARTERDRLAADLEDLARHLAHSQDEHEVRAAAFRALEAENEHIALHVRDLLAERDHLAAECGHAIRDIQELLTELRLARAVVEVARSAWGTGLIEAIAAYDAHIAAHTTGETT